MIFFLNSNSLTIFINLICYRTWLIGAKQIINIEVEPSYDEEVTKMRLMGTDGNQRCGWATLPWVAYGKSRRAGESSSTNWLSSEHCSLQVPVGAKRTIWVIANNGRPDWRRGGSIGAIWNWEENIKYKIKIKIKFLTTK